jgi:hypothetical protein
MFSTKISIQKGVPIPAVKPRGREGSSPAKYPWRKMSVGDSFLFPSPITRQAFAAASLAEKFTGYRFVVRKTDEGYRCWRIA